MYKQALRGDIGTIVHLLPRPLLNDKPLAIPRNSWLMLEEYEDGEGIIFLNNITNHEGKVPYDSIREYRKPDMLILRAQITLGREGEFRFEPFTDAPDNGMQAETVEILPERLSHAETALGRCTPDEKKTIRQLLIRQKMTNREIEDFCRSDGIPDGHKFFGIVNGKTSFLEQDEHHALVYAVWVKPAFVPILEKLLLESKMEKDVTASHPPSSSVPGSDVS